ncbi:DUF2460 domain-containing protein [Erythrobacteraceae bacterium E2-1 Yellow Sea]|nr:DUF2460 domain-containing protein [Erythrobacteraceae bacterium E2-1 Yellow Sea]
MAFWLARERRGQETSYIQRFDPRFWTVNFPRPAMASVVTTGPDSMQVHCEFHHQGELAGLIWESEDALDHPLLAYETARDYSRCTLRFHWSSSGIIPLDQANGPTLTIEGRDANGTPQSWYVRLWNYATGSPTDAQIELPFSSLEGGWFLPGSPVHVTDIDRLFISLVPPGYVPGSEEALPARVDGQITITGVECEGQKAMLGIGDVLVPPHGERIATAYDDAFNQTPARLIRSVIGLGYREELVHYVGMSHFMRLGSNGVGGLEAIQPATICAPAEQWHSSFFAEAKSSELEVIASISYELFAEYCPASWQQRAHDGEAALTGWVPPSALLSPSSSTAMDWVKQAALQFTTMQQDAGQPVRLQIGEPWWWVMADGRPCLYDDAVQQAYGGTPPVITDMRGPLDAGQLAYLDFAGAQLAVSTANIANAVRTAHGGNAEILLLAFTPTILDASMPELRRANLPDGWAYPAFDRLQLEDYDWLTSGADALRRAAYQTVDRALGYPADRIDYLAGFVLLAADADALWPKIDASLDEAQKRGVTRRFVWALPQICRDGYTRLPTTQEDELQAFDDILYPFPLGRASAVSPEFSTTVTVTSSGHERRNSLWSDARLHFDVGPGIRSEEELAELIGFFRARRGAARGFRVTDPFDHSSNGMIEPPTMNDQLLGVGDGITSDFALIKNYGDGPEPQIRPITRARTETLLVSVGGAVENGWTLEPGGMLRLLSAPPAGAEIRAGFLFDVPVRFAEDRIDVSGINFAAGEAPSIPLIEIREAS